MKGFANCQINFVYAFVEANEAFVHNERAVLEKHHQGLLVMWVSHLQLQTASTC